jgi:hypothetical protein
MEGEYSIINSPSVIFIPKVNTYCTKQKIAKAKQTLINKRLQKNLATTQATSEAASKAGHVMNTVPGTYRLAGVNYSHPSSRASLAVDAAHYLKLESERAKQRRSLIKTFNTEL